MAANTEHGAEWQGGLTRREVAARLKVSVSTVRRMEGTTLHPALDERGTWRFSAAEVADVASSRGPECERRAARDVGRIAARVFAAFAAGRDLREIVVALRVHPATVRDLYTHWATELEDAELKRREAQRSAAELREQREWTRWMRALR